MKVLLTRDQGHGERLNFCSDSYCAGPGANNCWPQLLAPGPITRRGSAQYHWSSPFGADGRDIVGRSRRRRAGLAKHAALFQQSIPVAG